MCGEVAENETGLAGFTPLSGGGGVPLFMPQTDTAPGTRSWQEVAELDAQSFMSISRLDLSER